MKYQNALNKLWEEVSIREVFKLKNFFKDIFLLFKYDLRLINPEKLNLKFDPVLLPDCGNCQQNCCHGAENTVSLRLSDIARLLDAGLADAINPDNQEFKKDIYFKKHKGILKKLNADNWKYFPVLKRVNNTCPYLDKNNKCTIYEYRPITCRRFPYILSETKKDVVFSKKCYKTRLENNLEKQRELFKAAVDSYNEKVKDLILLHYARKRLDEIGLGRYLITKQ